MPYLAAGKTAETFALVRSATESAVGYDFFAVVGDMARATDFVSKKAGVANRSWHKTCRAVDYNQNSPDYVLVYEPQQGRAYFRTYLRIKNGNVGVNLRERGIEIYSNGQRKNIEAPAGEWFDLTACYEAHGWERIPAWRTWSYGKGYSTSQEFWHYQFTEGMAWQEAMDWLNSDTDAAIPRLPTRRRVLGRNDRGEDVADLQRKLAALGFLDNNQVDGIFGKFTHDALKKFQAAHKLTVDGVAGPATWAALSQPLPLSPVPAAVPVSIPVPLTANRASTNPTAPPTAVQPATKPAGVLQATPVPVSPVGMRAAEQPVVVGAGDKKAFAGIASTSGVGVLLTALYAFWQANATLIALVFAGGLVLAVTLLVCLHQRHENNKARAANPALDNVE